MCTAISYTPLDHYFGRNLDLPAGYTEQVTITPRNFAFHFRNGLQQNSHYAMIGMATVANEYPLYYEATNEKGLSMAALNFPGFAAYQIRVCGKDNIAPFELIPWVLGQCQNVQEARKLLQKCSLWMLPYNREYKLTPLHWILSDRESSLVAEPLPNGLAIFDNPVGVLTNAPSFPYHMHRLSDFASLDNRPPQPAFWGKNIPSYSAGQGAIGLPGDYSSVSRFVKATYLKCHAISEGDEQNHVRCFFHMLQSVALPKGSVLLQNGAPQVTLYSSCCNTDKGIYYYTTYENSRISAVNLHHTNLDNDRLTTFPLRKFSEFFHQN